MKHFLITIFCIAFLISINSEPVFRGSEWGMSIEEVKAIENADLLQEDTEQLVYMGSVADLEAAIIYDFFKNELSGCGYMITETYTNKNEHIDNFHRLKELLIKKYGAPIKDEITWEDDLYKDDPSDYGFAISLGHLSYFAGWETDILQLSMLLYGNNYEISHGIFYANKDLQEDVDKAKEDSILDDL